MAYAQDLRTEIYTGSWQDISSYVYQRDTVHIQRGRQNEAATMQAGTATQTLNNRDGRFTTRNPNGTYYPNLVQNTPLRHSVKASDAGLPSSYLRLETDTASYASCPDSAGLQITSGTLSVRWDGQLTDWGPGNRVLVAKAGATALAWGMWTNGNGTIHFSTWDAGSVVHNTTSVPVPYYNQRIAIRVDYNITAQTYTFYTAPSMAGSWTQLGNVGSTSATTLNAGTGQIVQAGNGTTNLPGMYGAVYEVQVLQTGSVKADPVFSAQTAGVTSFTDAQSNTWTLNGTAEISDRLYRYHGELAVVPKAADPSATDVYSQATSYGVSQRLQNSNTPLQSPMRRAYVRLPSSLKLAAYWPWEDGANATSLGSGIGGPPMQITGTPSLASNTSFACSLPLPVMNGATFSATVPAGPAFTDASVRWLWAVPFAGETNGATVIQVLYGPGSTIASSTVVYTTGGFLNFSVFNAAGASIHSTGNVSFGVNNQQLRVAADLHQNGGNIDMVIATLAPGASSASVFTASSVVAGTVGAVTYVALGSSGITGSAMGHLSVQGVADSLFDMGNQRLPDGSYTGPLRAWYGETAAARVARLCSEESVNCRIVGPPDLSMPMGVQPVDTLFNILQQCESTDLGMLFEPRQALGLGYRTRTSMYHQTPVCTASYSGGALFQGFASSADTQLTVNDVTATAPSGSTARQFLATGPMSVLAPPSGISRIDTQISPNPALDSSLNQIASWYLSVRSVDDDRYPAIPFVMNRSATPVQAAILDVGDYLKITGTPAWLPPPPVSQLAAGFGETFFPASYWQLDVNGIPELPYETAVAGTGAADSAHADTAGSKLTSLITSAATSISVTTTLGPVWTTVAANFPFDIVVDREQMTVTNITGATSPQTFTVTRSVNGVVLGHAANAAVALYRKPIASL